MKKKLLLTAVVVGVSVAGLQAKDASLQIAFVDSFAAMRECEDGQKVGKAIDAMRDKASESIRKEAEMLAKAETELKQKASMLKPAELAKQEREFGKKRRDLEERIREEEEAIKMAMQQKTEELATQIEEGIVAVAKEKGVDAVIDKMTGRVMYTKDDNTGDLTKDAVAFVDRKSRLVAQSKTTQKTTVASADSKASAAA